jgi:folate-binding protein YgfZ
VRRFSLWVEDSAVKALWQRLLGAGATPAGADSVEALRVLEGTPLYGVDISDKTLAQETGQMRALNFSKGCYLGQEIVERVRSRANVHRGIRQFVLHGAAAGPGEPLSADGAAIGELTSVAQVELPQFSGQVALGLVRVEALNGALSYPGGSAEVLTSSPLG